MAQNFWTSAFVLDLLKTRLDLFHRGHRREDIRNLGAAFYFHPNTSYC